jgi:hypothetical protein
MEEETTIDRDTEWLLLAPPQGLVVSALALKEAGLVPTRQTQVDTARAAEFINLDDETSPHLRDPWRFFSTVLGWRSKDVAGSPDGPALPDRLVVRLQELDTILAPTWAVRATAAVENEFQLLIRVEASGVQPDARGALEGWEATPQQRFERLLRETRVYAGVLVTDKEIRLIYAPQSEASGWQSFPVRAFASVAGRPILGGFRLLLDTWRLFQDHESKRLPALLARSREAQASVSERLSSQVLGALHELLREFLAAERKDKTTLVSDLARDDPHLLYEGILTLLMRLVFVLYAEDRDLIPSKVEKEARWLYDQGYSVSGLFARLSNDEALNPDTMNDRVGGWGQLLALFRLIHGGHRSGFIRARGGKLFDPDAFPFIEGRRGKDDLPRVMAIGDGSLLRVLRGLMVLDGERISYRALDVEAIGSVYETVMGFTVEVTSGRSIAIKAGKNNKVPVFVDLDALAAMRPDQRQKYIKDDAGRSSLNDRQKRALKEAASADDVLAALDTITDERGSPGCRPTPVGIAVLQPTDERRRSGSHYTPRSLTEPIVRYALEPTFERIGADATPEQILDLAVCDPAMGSGAFLVEACRQLGARLQLAWERHPMLQPSLPADEDEELHARRLVAQRCLYGVDRNPMAVDLARLSLWLATLARDHEFEFLDHALKAGDSLVGLSNDQIGALSWVPNARPIPLYKDLFVQRLRESRAAREEIRDAPDDASRADQERRFKRAEAEADRVRRTGDAVVSAFFAAETVTAQERARQSVESQATAHGGPNWDEISRLAERLREGAHPLRPFHWETEFPEVFDRGNPGFDAIVGNPPFAGKNTMSAGNRASYPAWLQTLHTGAHGNADLVAHFFRRAFSLIRTGGTFGLIATNTIGQGDTRATGLTRILAEGGTITRGTRRLKWPGEAAVVVSVVHIRKGEVNQPVLDGRSVRRISAYLVEGDLDVSPRPLVANAGKAFVGSYILGMGFTFDDEAATRGVASSLTDMRRLITKDPRNAERILPFIGGEEVNNEPRHAHRRFVIDFGAMDEPGVRQAWPDLMEIVERLVKHKRGSHSTAPWWQFERRRGELYRAIEGLPRVLVNASKASPQYAIALLPPKMVYSQNLNVFALSNWSAFCSLQTRVHEVWARSFGTTLKDDLTYTLSDCFATFPFPPGFEASAELEVAGKAYHDHRASLMIARNQGLTKTYNRFHDPNEDDEDIVNLRELHADMDRAVLAAYGWNDLIKAVDDDPQYVSRHLTEADEDDHKYLGRYFWPATIRDEVLARLLQINASRAAEEAHLGLTVEVEEDADV